MQIQQFNETKSIDRVKILYGTLKKVTIDMVIELYKAQQYYSKQGKGSDFVPTGTNNYTFEQYLNKCLIPRRTAYNWLERFVPEEKRLLTVPEWRKKKLQPSRRKINPIEEKKRTDRVKKHFEELEKRTTENKRDQDNNENLRHVAREYVKAKLQAESKINEFQKKITGGTNYQKPFFDMIDGYVHYLNGETEQMEALQNIIKYCKRKVTAMQRGEKP